MGTPGLRLIQDLLAKSVAKWSGDAAKSIKNEKNVDIKIKTENIKVEYIETETVALDVRSEEENLVGFKRKLVKNETDKSGKKRMKADKMSNYEEYENNKGVVKSEADEIDISDKKDDKSLIKRLLENSATKFAANGDDKVGKMCTSDKLKSRKMKMCKEEVNIKTEKVEKIDMRIDDHIPTKAPDETKKMVKRTNPLLENRDAKRQNVTGVKKETRTRVKANRTNDVGKLKTKSVFQNKKINTQLRRFSPDEDAILQHAMDTFGDSLNVKNLAHQLGREPSSVHTRVRKLKTGSRRIDIKQFSIVEDLLIIDRMLERLPRRKLKDLELHVDSTTPAFLTKLGRTNISGTVRRWGIRLKPWILQHYAGTLNLDIRKMLANFLADTFDNADSIDWDLVASRPEFSGHTVFSLKYMFFSGLYRSTKKYQKLKPEEVTLRNIADTANSELGLQKKVTKKVLLRQKQVIDYFEQFVKKHGITDFL